MNFINNYSQTITLGPGDTSLALSLPDGEYRLTIADGASSATRWEIVGAVVEDGTATLTRGLEGTPVQDWPDGSVIYSSITAGILQEIYERIGSLEAAGGGDLPSEIGQPFGGGFYAGDIQYPDGQWYRLIVADISADITGEDSRWRTSDSWTNDAEHSIDGVANTNAMIAAGIELHPAAEHCVNHRGGGFEDWYMPALDELDVIYQNLGLDRPNCPPDFQSGGPQAFSDNFYWASTQQSLFSSLVQHFGDGSQDFASKGYIGNRVRPVRRVPFSP